MKILYNINQKQLNARWIESLMGLPPYWVCENKSRYNLFAEIHMLGNGVVPQTAAIAFRVLWNRISHVSSIATEPPAEPPRLRVLCLNPAPKSANKQIKYRKF